MSVDLTNEFDQFFESIELSGTQLERINSAVNSLSTYLQNCYGLKSTQIYTQGSFSTKSTIKPAIEDSDGEYDVDLIVECVDGNDTPEKALDTLEDKLRDNGTYKNKIETDSSLPCIRLRYADEDAAKFHVDVLPVRVTGDGTKILIPRRSEGWELSDPAAYTKWALSHGEQYRRVVMMFKRWRDIHDIDVKSIMLQVLIAGCIRDSRNEQERIASTIINLNETFKDQDSVPEIRNPVLPEEIISDSMKQSAYKVFKKYLAEHSVLATKILVSEDKAQAIKAWQVILGDEFKPVTNSENSLSILSELGDISHAQKIELVPTYPGVKVRIRAHFKKKYFGNSYVQRRGNVSVQRDKIEGDFDSETILPSGGHIDYVAEVSGLNGLPYRILWQVVNTGNEAASFGLDGLRGKLFESRDENNPLLNPESTRYEGVHWIECFVVVNDEIVARSNPFYIKIIHEPSDVNQLGAREEYLLY